MNKLLVVYYSRSNGNTRRIANQLVSETGADIAEIKTVKPYTGSYDEIVEQGQEEVLAGFKPPIMPLSADLADYDTVAVGTPTWWYTMAPAMLTFLSSQEWNGKTVIPFMTNGGWPGHVIKDIKAECEGAQFAFEKEIYFDSNGGDTLVTDPAEIDRWIDDIKRSVIK